MEKETIWIDAWIRWDRNSKDVVDEDKNLVDDDDEEEERITPTAEFSFVYRLPSLKNSSDDTPPRELSLALRGFPSESEQIWNSTGLTLWPSSHYLCEYLLDHYQDLLGIWEDGGKHEHDGEWQPPAKPSGSCTLRAVELGSGLGRCGLLLHHILAAHFGSGDGEETGGNGEQEGAIGSRVYLTDGDTDALAQLRDNVADNTGQAAAAGNDASGHEVSCHQLLWGRESTQAFCERHCSTGDGSSAVDLVFGSDLVYAPRVIGPLFETVRALLGHGRGAPEPATAPLSPPPVFLMAHSDRRQGSSVTLPMVLEGAEREGLRHDILQTVEREGIYVIAFRALATP